MKDIETLANRAKYFRKKLGLTQKELAQHIDVSMSSICEIENGKHKPSCDYLQGAAKVFNLNLYWLLFGDGEMQLDPVLPGINKKPRFQSNSRDIKRFLHYFHESAIVQHSVLAYFLTLLFKERESIEKELGENSGTDQ
jgi:transcriptional regulator with XRE-family HTH domain